MAAKQSAMTRRVSAISFGAPDRIFDQKAQRVTYVHPTNLDDLSLRRIASGLKINDTEVQRWCSGIQ